MIAKRPRKVYQTLFILIVLIFISGCSSKEPNAPGATVTEEQAIAIAQEKYGVTTIEEVDLRLLTDDELTLLNDEQSQLTPVYYVLNGTTEKQKITIYVSSNEVNHHFSK